MGCSLGSAKFRLSTWHSCISYIAGYCNALVECIVHNLAGDLRDAGASESTSKFYHDGAHGNCTARAVRRRMTLAGCRSQWPCRGGGSCPALQTHRLADTPITGSGWRVWNRGLVARPPTSEALATGGRVACLPIDDCVTVDGAASARRPRRYPHGSMDRCLVLWRHWIPFISIYCSNFEESIVQNLPPSKLFHDRGSRMSHGGGGAAPYNRC